MYSVRLRPLVAEIPALLDGLEDYARAQGLPARAAGRLATVCEELVVNVATHGGSGASFVQITVRRNSDGLLLRVEDDGIAFNPLDAAVPDVGADMEHRGIGGLGIHMVRNMVDSARYERLDDRNCLTLGLAFRE